MNKIKIYLLTVLTISILIMFAGCSKKEPTTLTIGVLPNLDSIPMILAKENGYLGEHIELSYFKSAVDRDTALQTGNIDGTASDLLSAIFLKDNQFDMQVTSKTQGAFAIVTTPGLQADAIKADTSIGISSNTIIEYLTDIYALSQDMGLNKVAIPKMPTRLEMLQHGKIDLAMLPEPLAHAAVLNGGTYVTTSDAIGTNPAVMIFSQASIDKKAGLISDFYRGYNQAVDYIKDTDRETYMDVVMEKAGFPPTTRDTLTLPAYEHASLPDESELERVNKWMLEKELTKQTYTFDDMATPQFIE
ncbi:ABC transporter substrate-binding protein [Vallitalea pronyensis]|uniref:ABC transporter substrate-binding protein n=1 Tax=Vallitalea pronyensis TaxID=1348613 RepID=A0A8J8SFL3_9FIRM|nr:ABC transporter substrate-binding protein [Vallitalea pronyensis]QUI21716.1 ABC transporter substrate-binding protein [Vallitalea pronyensis]